MQQIKLFSGSEDQMGSVERDVNDWLRASGARIVNIFGNMSPQSVLSGESRQKVSMESGSRRFAPSDVFVCIVYEKA
ncbi:hypothetical protein PHYC_00179 [Phycisphaerales bacterium]|nr:hypothetical protein PHYC_00179 [Phycisphaerales bacterium]